MSEAEERTHSLLSGSIVDAGAQAPSGLSLRRIAAVVAGNALEFYDFLAYSFFAVQIGNTFFPQHAGASTLLLSELVFFAGFLPRPFGGLVFGMLGDRWGRKPAMILTFSLMGVAIVGFALTPSYHAIGIAAPILILCFRLIQGFALGGEVGPTTAYLLESAAPKNRGFYTSIQYGTQDLAVLIAGLIGFGLANVLDANALQDWGWRAAFLLGACVIPFGLAVRRNLPETMLAADAAKSKLRDMRFHLRPAIIGFILLSSMSVTYYVIAYLTTYATATLHMPSNVAFGASVVAGLCGVIFDVASGALSDKVGRKPIMLIAGPLLIATVLPAFYFIAHFHSTAALLGATAVFCILQSFYAPPILISLTESLPRPIRSSGLAIVYALAVTIVGGATQPVVTRMIEVTGSPLAPAWLLLCTLTIGFVAVLFVRETAPVKTGIVTP